jgi:hypothetical protein
VTIIKRAVDALNDSGHKATATELLEFATGLKDRTLQLMDLYSRQSFLMKKLISVMMARCPHHEWVLATTNQEGDPSTWGPENTIICHSCGHTVCDERAYAFGKRVRMGDYFIHSRANGRRFALNPQLRKQLGDKLNVKEITGEYCEERDGDSGKGAGQVETPAAVGHTEQGRAEAAGGTVG